MSGASSFLDSSALPWRETHYPGVRWKKLHFDPGTGRSAVLLEFAPGAAYGAHRHPRGEQYLVLEGALEDAGKSYAKGTYVNHPPGSAHAPSSRSGAILFVILEAPIESVESLQLPPLSGA